ncbi:SCP2 sterol-binding domain-containing protein [Desertimonas flava]|uniref:SCP2 sterol-binding domain-containing protein n=1 Tax=Desertimonas flava TaxID=2064846 RepID=UPI000E340A6B|nr:SCP2 sterol-binding domain-containing protein [Desertimonas flava]
MKATTLVSVARRTPRPILRMATRRPASGAVIGQVFRRMPELLSPAGRKARGVIRFDIRTGSAVETWYATFGAGTCTTGRRVDTRPRVTISLEALDFVQLASGTDPIELFRAGRLRLAGDTYFGASVGELFDLRP